MSRSIDIKNSISGLVTLGDGNIRIDKIAVNSILPEKSKPRLQNNDFNLPKLGNVFKGREEEMCQLSKWFFEENKQSVTICGLPGFGKTELALNFVQKLKSLNEINHILWINSETIDKSFQELAKCINLDSSFGLDTLTKEIYEYFNNSAIFVFDNVINNLNHLPKNSLCLITTQINLDLSGTILKLKPLLLNDAVEVFSSLPNFTQHMQLFRDLAADLECIPLMLTNAMELIKKDQLELRSRFDIVNCIDRFKNHKSILFSDLSFFRNLLEQIANLNDSKSSIALLILDTIASINNSQICIVHISRIKAICDEIKLINTENKNDCIFRALSMLDEYQLIYLEDDFEGKIITYNYVRLLVRLCRNINIKTTENLNSYITCDLCGFYLIWQYNTIAEIRAFVSKNK